MNIAIFGGAFNPITNAHLNIITTVIKMIPQIDELFIEIAHDSYKNINTSYYHRSMMVKQSLLILSQHVQSKTTIGFYDQSQTVQPFSYETLKWYKNISGINDVYCIIGSDQLISFNNWKNSDELLKNYKWVIAGRDQYVINNIIKKGDYFYIPTMKSSYISSTIVRDRIFNNISSVGLITDNVLSYIKINNLYQK